MSLCVFLHLLPLFYSPCRLKKFESGVLVVELLSHSEDSLLTDLQVKVQLSAVS